ncbi:MAG: hypothetical protein IT247_09685 [Bacteroidia bacterium]|nr:hypothetical protein [Bacteroidia bacterium]
MAKLKIRSSSLVEVIISMVIITATFSIVVFIFSALGKEGVYRQKLQAISLLQQQVIYLDQKQSDFKEINIDTDGLHVSIAYAASTEHKHLILATIIITNNESRVLCTLKKYIRN